MNFKTMEEALNYLRGLETIIMPSQFTYFNHCTSYQAENIKASSLIKKAWTSLPIEDFVIGREMSFSERTQRIHEALGYGGREKANLRYAMPTGAKPFIIRVVIPKRNLNVEEKRKLEIDDEYNRLLQQEYMGLGDGRHPKLRNKEHIMMFASSTIDEVSGQRIDILYGVREQDVIRYANAVKEALSIRSSYDECVIPTPIPVPGQCYYEWDRDYKFERETYSIPRDKTFSRYIRKGVVGPSGEIELYQLSDFEQEYLDELRKNYTNSEDENIKSSLYHK